MNNLRIVYDNATARATLSATNPVAAYPVTNLQTDRKSNLWRSTTTSAQINATWASPEALQAVAFPFCNWSPTATTRVRITSELSITNYIRYSEDLSNATYWVPTLATVELNNASAPTAPFGGKMCKLKVDTTAASNHQLKQSSIPVTSQIGDRITASIFVAAAEYSQVYWIFSATGLAFSSSRGANFDLTTGTVSLLSGSTTAGMVNMGGGIWRIWISSVADGAGTTSVALYPASATGTSTGRATLATADGVSGVFMCGCQVEKGFMTSYYPTATTVLGVRPLGYIDSWQSYAYDSTVSPCPAPAINLHGFTSAQAASAYAYGGGTVATVWLPTAIQAYGVAISISDPNNLQGYLEAGGALVLGGYWSPTYNTASVAATTVDSSTHYRTDAGDLMTDYGTSYKKVPIELKYMPSGDRTTLTNILRNSLAYPVFLSVFPAVGDNSIERDHTVYGKRTASSDIVFQTYGAYSSQMEIQSI